MGPSGVLVIDKPRGPTSHDVVATIRRVMRTREVGHAGTLDPMATGVLVIALGEATKLVPYLTRSAKDYVARLELGRETDTLDAMGNVVAERAPDEDLLAALEAVVPTPRLAAAVAAELARTAQDPPVYSAIQTGGERAYALARRGEEVILEPRAVRVHHLAITGMGRAPAPWLELEVRADKGYYVRSLGRDLARALGTVGHLTSLRRTASGGFTLHEATPLSSPRAELEARLLPLADAARRALPSATLAEPGVVDARFGRRVRLEDFDDVGARSEPTAWFDRAGTLVAVGTVEEDGRVVRGFAPVA